SARIREILISEPAWEEMTCLFALSLDNIQKCIMNGDDGNRLPVDFSETAFETPVCLLSLRVLCYKTSTLAHVSTTSIPILVCHPDYRFPVS
ncbi:hypothetical protein, partial [Aeromonas veronii]